MKHIKQFEVSEYKYNIGDYVLVTHELTNLDEYPCKIVQVNRPFLKAETYLHDKLHFFWINPAHINSIMTEEEIEEWESIINTIKYNL